MNADAAMHCLAYVVGLTEGWSDAMVATYQEEFELYSDPEALMEALRDVIRARHDRFVPPLGDINDAYRDILRRRALERGLPKAEEPTIGWREGLEIAKRAYRVERNRLGLEIHEGMVESYLARMWDRDSRSRG